MDNDLKKFIEEFRISDYRDFDEQKTKQAIISRVLHILGWDTFNPSELCSEAQVTGGRVDYSLRIGNIDKVFIEAKRFRENLEPNVEQLLRYTFAKGVRLALLTNGKEWWFYYALKEVDWKKCNFLKIDFKTWKIDKICEKLTTFLAKSNIINESAYILAERTLRKDIEKEVIKNTIPKALEKILTEHNRELIRLIRKRVFEISSFKPDNKSTMNKQIKEEIDKLKDYYIYISLNNQKSLKISAESMSPPLTSDELINSIIAILIDNNGYLQDVKIADKFFASYKDIFNNSNSTWKIRNDKGIENWRKILQNIKIKMVHRNIIEKGSKGFWRLTEIGRDYIIK